MANQFDELAKDLAAGVTRREALRRFGGGLAGALLASFGLAGVAQGANARQCSIACSNFYQPGPARAQCNQVCKTCSSTGKLCPSGGGTICCESGSCCSSQSGAVCCQSGRCCYSYTGPGVICCSNSTDDCCYPGVCCPSGTCDNTNGGCLT